MSNRKNIAVIVQRAGEDLVGGSEGYAAAMARVLAEKCNVHILTTTAKDHMTWRNEYREEETRVSETLAIKRFKVDFERDRYWFELNALLMRGIPLDLFLSLPANERESLVSHIRDVPLGLAEEWMRYQGPYSGGLLEYLRRSKGVYDCYFFMTYLYPTTYFGIEAVADRSKAFIVPTFHNEPPAYLPIFSRYKRYTHLFLTNAEREVVQKNIYRERSGTESSASASKTGMRSLPGRRGAGRNTSSTPEDWRRPRASCICSKCLSDTTRETEA